MTNTTRTLFVVAAWLTMVVAPPLAWWLINGTNNLF
jgi:hypothetical protein